MATTVESPGITSAKEEAAAILFARETQTPPVMSAPAPEQPVREHEYHPVFASYHEPVTIAARPKAVDTTELRPYKTYEEVVAMSEPTVVHPGIDSGDYTSSVATTSGAATSGSSASSATAGIATVPEKSSEATSESAQELVRKRRGKDMDRLLLPWSLVKNVKHNTRYCGTRHHRHNHRQSPAPNLKTGRRTCANIVKNLYAEHEFPCPKPSLELPG